MSRTKKKCVSCSSLVVPLGLQASGEGARNSKNSYSVQRSLDYTIRPTGGAYGMQYVVFTLKPEQKLLVEAGSMMYYKGDLAMKTSMGDGAENTSFGKKLKRGLKQVFTGRSFFTTSFENKSAEEVADIGIAAAYPGTIIPLKLEEMEGGIFCEKGAFLASAESVQFDISFNANVKRGFLGGEGFLLQKLEGRGLCLLHTGGSVHTEELGEKDAIKVDTGCIVAYEGSVTFATEKIRGIKNVLFGKEGLVLATLTGPGKVWIQSMPFERMLRKITRAVKAEIK